MVKKLATLFDKIHVRSEAIRPISDGIGPIKWLTERSRLPAQIQTSKSKYKLVVVAFIKPMHQSGVTLRF